jgi:proprotein convertase subtilisin/kexin type 5
VNECPSGTATAGRTCLPCVSPCLTCAAISTNCTGCLPNYYFYSSTSLCYSSCPADISVNDTSSTSLNCLPCSSPCLYCSVAPTQCTACATGSLYQSQCYATCPDGYYGLGGICQLCTGNCLTCVTTSNTCTSCVSPFLKYGASCLSSCPVTHSIVVANTCTSCSNSCLNCNSSDYCSSCPSNLALYLGTCLSVCPSPLLLYYNTSSG